MFVGQGFRQQGGVEGEVLVPHQGCQRPEGPRQECARVHAGVDVI
jgi:hypothetical protein